MKGKPVSELKDNTYQSIVAKSCSDYKDYFALDVPKYAEKLYKPQTESYLYIPAIPNLPTGR